MHKIAAETKEKNTPKLLMLITSNMNAKNNGNFHPFVYLQIPLYIGF